MNAEGQTGLDLVFRKLVVIGNPSVGRHSLVETKCEGKFPEERRPTFYDFKISVVEVEGQRVKMQLWVPVGGERFRTLTSSIYRGTSAVLICFAIDDGRSFDGAIGNWWDQISENAPTIPVILVGMKNDLRKEGNPEADLISYEEAKEAAENRKAWAYLEVSSKTGDGVDELFETAAKAALTIPWPQSQARKTTSNHISRCLLL